MTCSLSYRFTDAQNLAACRPSSKKGHNRQEGNARVWFWSELLHGRWIYPMTGAEMTKPEPHKTQAAEERAEETRGRSSRKWDIEGLRDGG